jgi:hypothetical protein
MLARGRMNSIGQLGKGHVARVLPALSGATDCPSLAFCVDIGLSGFPPFSGAKRTCAIAEQSRFYEHTPSIRTMGICAGSVVGQHEADEHGCHCASHEQNHVGVLSLSCSPV